MQGLVSGTGNTGGNRTHDRHPWSHGAGILVGGVEVTWGTTSVGQPDEAPRRVRQDHQDVTAQEAAVQRVREPPHPTPRTPHQPPQALGEASQMPWPEVLTLLQKQAEALVSLGF